MSGRALPGPPTPDDGLAPAALRRALDLADGSPTSRAAVLAQLPAARLFVPVTATATEERVDEATGLRADSSAQMALVSLLSAAGERAVPAFLDVASLLAWRPQVRPVPVGVPYLCRSALDDGAVAVLLDPGGAGLLLTEAELTALAEGFVPVPGTGVAFRRTTAQWSELDPAADPALVRALAAAIRPERLRAARLLQGPAGLALGVVPRRDLDPAELAALAQRVLARLGSALPVGGLDLAVVPDTGPGLPVPVRRVRWPARIP